MTEDKFDPDAFPASEGPIGNAFGNMGTQPMTTQDKSDMTDKLMDWVTKTDLRTKLFVCYGLYGACGAIFGTMFYIFFSLGECQ